MQETEHYCSISQIRCISELTPTHHLINKSSLVLWLMHVLRWKRTHIHLFVLYFYWPAQSHPPSFLTVYYGCLYNMFLFWNSVFLVPCRCFTSQAFILFKLIFKTVWMSAAIKPKIQSIKLGMQPRFIDIDIAKLQSSIVMIGNW